MGATRIVLAVVCFFSAITLFLFASMMSKRSVTMALICAKHAWNPDDKAHGMRMAALMYLGGGVTAMMGEAVFGWFANTPTGQKLAQLYVRCYYKVYRSLFQKDSGLKSSDNSDDELEDLGHDYRARISGQAAGPSRHVRQRSGGSPHVRTSSGFSRLPSAAPEGDDDGAATTTGGPPSRVFSQSFKKYEVRETTV